MAVMAGRWGRVAQFWQPVMVVLLGILSPRARKRHLCPRIFSTPVVAGQWAQSGTILATNDGGLTWSPQVSGTSYDLRSVNFADASRGWAIGDVILVTTDGGLTWNSQTSGTTQRLLSSYFLDASRGWAVGDAGTVLATSDSGATWNLHSVPPLNSVYLEDSGHGWVVGDNGVILATGNGGGSWKAPDLRYSKGPEVGIFFRCESRLGSGFAWHDSGD